MPCFCARSRAMAGSIWGPAEIARWASLYIGIPGASARAERVLPHTAFGVLIPPLPLSAPLVTHKACGDALSEPSSESLMIFPVCATFAALAASADVVVQNRTPESASRPHQRACSTRPWEFFGHLLRAELCARCRPAGCGVWSRPWRAATPWLSSEMRPKAPLPRSASRWPAWLHPSWCGLAAGGPAARWTACWSRAGLPSNPEDLARSSS